jgi:hypothetical protein
MSERGTGAALVRSANRRGLLVFVDTDGAVKCYPRRLMSDEFMEHLGLHYHELRHFLIADAVTIE